MAVRYHSFLRQRYKLILGYTGLMCLVVGGLILTPLLLLVIYRHEQVFAGGFLWPGLGLALPGLLLWWRLTPAERSSLTWQEGTVVILLSWVLAIIVGAIPFVIISGLTFTQAIFESTSGWTTTGLSVVDVTQAPYLLLFYRSTIQWAGGAGFVIIMLSTLTGPTGSGLSIAEGRSEQLLPNVRRSAGLVFTMYTSFTVVGSSALYLAGMHWFDALNHAFAALSTGGFSTRAESIGYWDNPVIEGVVIILMVFGTLNFLMSYALFQGKFKVFFRNGEIRQQAFLAFLGMVIVFLGVVANLYPTLQKTIRVAAFETISAISTTGFATVDYRPWNSLGWLVFISLMLIGGGSGSTAGGIKQYRIYILYRGLLWQFQRVFLPRHTVNEPEVWQGEHKQFLNNYQISQVGVFVFLHLVAFFVGGGVIAAHGYTLQDSLFEFASALNTVGLSIGVTAPNAPPGVLWVETIGMFLGRLEFFTVIIGLVKLTTDLRTLIRKTDPKARG